MIVYGDRERAESTHDAFARLGARLLELGGVGRSRARHAACAEFAIECGMLVQALVDREFAARGDDELSPVAEAGARLCLAAGQAFTRGDLTPLAAALAALRACAPDAELRLREPEGYAFYALYPDLYGAAARTWQARDAPLQVIGIRSIGTSLAGVVAGALEAERIPFTVRPVGHPFARELRVGARLTQALLEHASDARYLIVDEGPGLSGSSFLAVADWLCARGVRREQICFFPSHSGEPGAQSSPVLRDRYRSSQRRFVPFEAVFDADALRGWFPEQLIGPGPAQLTDLSGGRWRARFYGPAASLPPSRVRDERRKYLLERDEQSWLMTYIGLGERARRIISRAQILSEHGFTPELVGVHYGMTLSRFHGEAMPLPLARAGREALVAQLARYLAFLAQRFRTSEPEAGAAPDELLALAKHNTTALLGAERAAPLAGFDALLPLLRATHMPIASDNKLDACEWLARPDGRWLKCDAETHHTGHDCIGCQDPSWDVAGASIELGLNDAERERVLAQLRDRAGLRIVPEKLAFFELAYAAFRAGVAHYAELSLAGSLDDDAARWRAEKARYAGEIARRLDRV